MITLQLFFASAVAILAVILVIFIFKDDLTQQLKTQLIDKKTPYQAELEADADEVLHFWRNIEPVNLPYAKYSYTAVVDRHRHYHLVTYGRKLIPSYRYEDILKVLLDQGVVEKVICEKTGLNRYCLVKPIMGE